jgi:hypothetical protein
MQLNGAWRIEVAMDDGELGRSKHGHYCGKDQEQHNR